MSAGVRFGLVSKSLTMNKGASMTRKDYKAIAGAIAQAKAHEIQMGAEGRDLAIIGFALESVAREIAKVLQADNPRFDRDKFLTACGLGVSV